MKKNVVISLALGFIFLLGLTAVLLKNAGRPPKTTEPGKLKVAASFYPLYFMAAEIGGAKAEAVNIMPAGAEPHDYEPTARELAKMANSRLIILNGGGFEAWSDNLKKNIDPGQTTIIAVGEELTEEAKTDGQKNLDPHAWLAPPLAEKMVEKIAQSFEQVDPLNKNYYRANAEALKSKLNDLHNAYKQGLANCAKKNIITSHAAFGYLAKSYGFNQTSITGPSPDAEPTPAELAEIIKYVRDNEIKFIFFESLASPKLAETVAAEVGAKMLALNPLEGLSDEELAQGKNYLSLMRDNLINLQIALACLK